MSPPPPPPPPPPPLPPIRRRLAYGAGWRSACQALAETSRPMEEPTEMQALVIPAAPAALVEGRTAEEVLEGGPLGVRWISSWLCCWRWLSGHRRVSNLSGLAAADVHSRPLGLLSWLLMDKCGVVSWKVGAICPRSRTH